MIVVDASVLIAHFDPTDAHHAAARELLLSVADEQFVASPITLAEFLVGPTRAGRLDTAETNLQALGVDAVPLPDDAADRLASLRAHSGVKLPDCCVLLAAQQRNAGIVTFDERLRAAARDLGLRVL